MRPLALIALGAVLMATAACGIATNGPPSAIAKDNVPFPLLNPVAPTTTTNPATPPAVAVPEMIYLVAPSQHVIAVSATSRSRPHSPR